MTPAPVGAELEILKQQAQAEVRELRQRIARLSDDGIDLILRGARSHYDWTDDPVTDDDLRNIYDIAKLGPTSMNTNPARYVIVRSQEAKQRIIVPHKEVQDLGFEGVKQEGVSVTTEFGMVASTGYLLNIDKMHMRCLDGQLFVPRGPEYDIRTDSYLFLLGWFGNMFWEPKFFSKIGDLT